MTEDTFLPVVLPAVQRKKVTADFAGGSISSDGGLVLLRAAERRLGLAETLAGCIRETSSAPKSRRRSSDASTPGTETQTTTLVEDIDALRSLLVRLERARSAAEQPVAESGLATQIAEAEGRIAGHVDNLAESIRPVRDALPDIENLARTAASTPERLERLATGVERSAEAVRAQDKAIRANTGRRTCGAPGGRG